SSGMYAFGDAFIFVVVFGVIALIPTALALYWLRPYRRFWLALSILGLACAATGLAAIILFAMGRHAGSPSPLAMWAAFSVLRILAAPLLAITLLLFAIVSPFRVPRRAFAAASAAEAVVSAYGVWVWFIA